MSRTRRTITGPDKRSNNKICKSKELAKQADPLTAKKDELFDQVSVFNAFSRKVPDSAFCNNEADGKRMKIFDGGDSFPLLYKLISIVFYFPVSIAFVECAFSLVLARWTDERGSFCKSTIQYLCKQK